MLIKDIFYSYQGEGPWVGYPQIFIRFYGCNIHCAYCDEPDFVKDKKKFTVNEVLSTINTYRNQPLHSISITGGEPLLYASYFKELLPKLPAPAYLETNGTLPTKLPEVKDLFTYFSVDYKPGYEGPFEQFINQLQDHPGCFVKYILMNNFPDSDLHTVGKILSKRNPNIPFVIQPVTPFAEITEKASEDDIHRGYSLISAYLNNVRIIPQTHKLIDLK